MMIKNDLIKKLIIKISLGFGFCLFLFSVLRLLGFFHFAMVPTEGNEPNIKVNSLLLATSLLNPKKNEFVLFDQINPKHPSGIYVQRLVGTENDKVQIINGYLYVNDIMIDNNFELCHSYIVWNDYFSKSYSKRNENYQQISEDKFIVHLSKKDLSTDFEYVRYISQEPDPMITAVYKKKWNADNFGPVIVPKNKIFTLGDNRNASLDSRYLGFIDVENIKGSVLFHLNNR